MTKWHGQSTPADYSASHMPRSSAYLGGGLTYYDKVEAKRSAAIEARMRSADAKAESLAPRKFSWEKA